MKAYIFVHSNSFLSVSSFEQLSDSVFARMCVILFVTDFTDYGMDRMLYGMVIVEWLYLSIIDE